MSLISSNAVAIVAAERELLSSLCEHDRRLAEGDETGARLYLLCAQIDLRELDRIEMLHAISVPILI